MTRIIRVVVASLAPLGLLIGAGALVWTLVAPRPLPGGLRPWLIAALALVLVHLILRWEDVSRGLGLRQLKYGTNTLVLVLVVLGILGAVNYLVSRHTKRVDLTANQRYSLSDQTRKVLAGLEDAITITYFQRRADMARGRERFKEYEALSDRLEVVFVDPEQRPGVAQQYDISSVPTIVVERPGRRERLTNDSEQDITNALIKVTREGMKTVCFVEGEGERSGEDTSERGFSGARTALTKNLYETKTVFLQREGSVPEDCTVVVVAGPQKDLTPETISPLREYVAGGGKALFMIEPEFEQPSPNLVSLLEEWNITVGHDILIDQQGVGAFEPLVIDYPYHQITKDLGGLMTAFRGARSVQAGDRSVEGVRAQNLVQTSPASWAESNLGILAQSRITPDDFDEKTDRLGPVSLAAAATIEGEAPEPEPSPSPVAGEGSDEAGGDEEESEDVGKKAPEGRVVAVGDADFASNARLGFYGNQDLFLNMVAWLAEDVDLISIRPQEPENQTLFLGPQRQLMVFLVALVVLPLAFVIAGVVTWWRRR